MLFQQDCMAYLCHNKMAILCIWWNARVILTYAQPQTLKSQERLTPTDLQAFLAGGIFCYSYGTVSEYPSPKRTLRKPRLQWEGLTNTAVNQPRANPYIKRRILPIQVPGLLRQPLKVTINIRMNQRKIEIHSLTEIHHKNQTHVNARMSNIMYLFSITSLDAYAKGLL